MEGELHGNGNLCLVQGYSEQLGQNLPEPHSVDPYSVIVWAKASRPGTDGYQGRVGSSFARRAGSRASSLSTGQAHWQGRAVCPTSPAAAAAKSDSVRPHRRQDRQAPPSLGFSRQEHWSGLPFPSPMHESEK